MKLSKVMYGVLLATGATSVYGGEFKALSSPEKAIPNQYIVVLKDDVVQQSMGLFSTNANEQAITMVSENLGRKYRATVKNTYKTVLKGGVFEMTEKDAHRLAQDSRVAFVEPDQYVSINASQSNATWGIDRVDQRNLPLNGTYNYSGTASNVNAYIIDTGILNSHSEFGGRAVNGYDFIDNDGSSNDCNGHGTHVAGTVGGNLYGVAKGVKLIGVKVLGCDGGGSNSSVINGMDWVANNHQKPAVANMSLGGGASSAVDQAVQRMVNAGVTVVAAAGNDNGNACSYSPARAANAITVGSTTKSDARSNFSNYGSCLDIYAPGSNIKSAWSNGGTNTISGTSMAAPHVAGIAALYLSGNPSASPAQVTQAVLNNATPNKVSDAKSGSPNLLAYSVFGNTPPPPGGGNELQKGVAVSVSGAQGSETFYTLEVPAGATDLSFNISGGTGDADLYVRFGSKPTSSDYDCRPYLNGNTESCDIASVQAGTYHVMLKGYSSYSGVSLVANFEGDVPPPPPSEDDFKEENISGAQGAWVDYTVTVAEGVNVLTVKISGGTGDADLYVRQGSYPTTSAYDCRPYREGNEETCVINNPTAGTWYLSLRGYSSFSGVTLTANGD